MNWIEKTPPGGLLLFSKLTGERARLMQVIAGVQLLGLLGFMVQEYFVSVWFEREWLPYLQTQLLVTISLMLDELVILAVSAWKWKWAPLVFCYRIPDCIDEGVGIIETSWNQTIAVFQVAKFIAIIDLCLVPLMMLSIVLMVMDVLRWGRLKLGGRKGAES